MTVLAISYLLYDLVAGWVDIGQDLLLPVCRPDKPCDIQVRVFLWDTVTGGQI